MDRIIASLRKIIEKLNDYDNSGAARAKNKISSAITILERAKNKEDSDIQQVREICEYISEVFDGHLRQNVVNLLIGTIAVESNFIYRIQLGDGPARGLCQMEPETAKDIFDNYLRYRPVLWGKLRAVSEKFRDKVSHGYESLSKKVLSELLRRDDYFSIAMARLHYLRVPEAIPDTISKQAMYWKTHFNTYKGKGTVEKYIEVYNRYNLGGEI